MLSCREWGLLSSHGTLALECGLGSCGATDLVAQWHVGISVSKLGTKAASPALAGRFSTTGPPGKSPHFL